MKLFTLLSTLLERLYKGNKRLFYINGAETLPRPLTPEEEARLLTRIEEEEAVRQKLVEHNLRLVVYIAKKFENTGAGIEDLISIGTIGLIKAVNTFDPMKKIKLATYASRCIENEILMFLRRTSRQKLEVSLDEPLNTDDASVGLPSAIFLYFSSPVIWKACQRIPVQNPQCQP